MAERRDRVQGYPDDEPEDFRDRYGLDREDEDEDEDVPTRRHFANVFPIAAVIACLGLAATWGQAGWLMDIPRNLAKSGMGIITGVQAMLDDEPQLDRSLNNSMTDRQPAPANGSASTEYGQ